MDTKKLVIKSVNKMPNEDQRVVADKIIASLPEESDLSNVQSRIKKEFEIFKGGFHNISHEELDYFTCRSIEEDWNFLMKLLRTEALLLKKKKSKDLVEHWQKMVDNGLSFLKN